MQKISYKLVRLEAQILRVIALLIEREIEDSRAKQVTISEVKLSRDLRHARIYFTVRDESCPKNIAHALNHTVPYLRRRIGESLSLRIVPELFFSYDQRLAKAEKLVRLIENLK